MTIIALNDCYYIVVTMHDTAPRNLRDAMRLYYYNEWVDHIYGSSESKNTFAYGLQAVPASRALLSTLVFTVINCARWPKCLQL